MKKTADNKVVETTTGKKIGKYVVIGAGAAASAFVTYEAAKNAYATAMTLMNIPLQQSGNIVSDTRLVTDEELDEITKDL